VDGNRDIPGLCAGDGKEGAKYWAQVLTELKNRGVADVCMVVCDGLKGLPDSIGLVWPEAISQPCVAHLLRASFRYASRQDWDKIAKSLRSIYTAATAKAAEKLFLEFGEEWGKKYPAIVRLWESSWAEFVPFLQFDAELRRIVCTTNAIESAKDSVHLQQLGAKTEACRAKLEARGYKVMGPGACKAQDGVYLNCPEC